MIVLSETKEVTRALSPKTVSRPIPIGKNPGGTALVVSVTRPSAVVRGIPIPASVLASRPRSFSGPAISLPFGSFSFRMPKRALLAARKESQESSPA